MSFLKPFLKLSISRSNARRKVAPTVRENEAHSAPPPVIYSHINEDLGNQPPVSIEPHNDAVGNCSVESTENAIHYTSKSADNSAATNRTSTDNSAVSHRTFKQPSSLKRQYRKNRTVGVEPSAIDRNLDDVDLTCLDYARTIKKLSPYQQTIVKFQISQLLMNVELGRHHAYRPLSTNTNDSPSPYRASFSSAPSFGSLSRAYTHFPFDAPVQSFSTPTRTLPSTYLYTEPHFTHIPESPNNPNYHLSFQGSPDTYGNSVSTASSSGSRSHVRIDPPSAAPVQSFSTTTSQYTEPFPTHIPQFPNYPNSSVSF